MSTKRKRKQSTLASLKKTVQAKANLYARLRDCYGTGGAACISCYQWFSFEDLDGGHYIPTTTASTRYNEENINAQCHRCNRFLHANLRGYFRGLEAKIGRDRLDALEAAATGRKYTRPELMEINNYYAEKIKAIRRGEAPSDPGLAVLDMFQDLAEARDVS